MLLHVLVPVSVSHSPFNPRLTFETEEELRYWTSERPSGLSFDLQDYSITHQMNHLHMLAGGVYLMFLVSKWRLVFSKFSPLDRR